MLKLILRDLEKSIAVGCLDYMWKEQLKAASQIRETVNWRVYAKKDPYSEYLREVFCTFISSKDVFKYYTLFMLFRVVLL